MVTIREQTFNNHLFVSSIEHFSSFHDYFRHKYREKNDIRLIIWMQPFSIQSEMKLVSDIEQLTI